MGVQVFLEPGHPELLEADAATQDEVLVEVEAGEGLGLGVVALLELSVVGQPGAVVGQVGPHHVEHRLAVLGEGGATHLDRQVAAWVGLGAGGRQPGREDGTAGGRDGVHLLVGTAVLDDDLAVDPAVGLHPRQRAVDLLVRRGPEEPDRPLEAPCELEPRCRPLAERDEESVLEGHALSVACYATSCKPVATKMLE
ncbi:hypothetical protein NOCA2220124 [metagenome]|uniref:Uncharacterized protein n=1 Tax=metagenome TaxID=256318 RepID=A0A2P2BYV0_9ZZZZ